MAFSGLAVGYLRCSTDMQEDSPEQQRREILTFASTQGFRVSEWFIDHGKSGTTFEQRPEFQRLKKVVEAGPTFKTVICYDESRWGRAIDSEENTYWRVHFRRHGVRVLLVKTSVDPKNDFAPMLQAFEGVQASQYSKKLSELTLRGAKANETFSSGGSAPYGYTRLAVNRKTAEERQLKPGQWCSRGQEKVKWTPGEQKEMEVIRRIFRERAKGKACVLIAKGLNDSRIPSPQRGRWRTRDQKWSAVTILTMIQNPAYYGARAYNRNSMSKIIAASEGRESLPHVPYPHWRNEREKWVLIENAHEPLVSKELWEKANSKGTGPRKQPMNGYSYRSRYLLTGLVVCSKCGFAFQGWSGRSKGRSYNKYVDSGWVNKRVCDWFAIDQVHLESAVVEAIKNTLSEPTTTSHIETSLRKLMATGAREPDPEVKTYREKMLDLVKRKANLIRAIESGAAGESLYSLVDRLRNLDEEEGKIRKRIHESGVTDTLEIDYRDAGVAVADFILNFRERFEEMSPEDRKAQVKRCVSRIVVDKERGIATAYIRRIPAALPAIEQLYQKQRPLTTGVVSGRSSGDRT